MILTNENDIHFIPDTSEIETKEKEEKIHFH